MKSRHTNLIKFLTVCIAPAIAGLSLQSAHAANATWTGATDNILNTATNWNAAPPTGSGEIATWDGTQAGNLALTWTTGGYGAGGGTNGMSINITSGQTSNLLIGSSSTTANSNADNINIGNITIASGAGAVTFGDGIGYDDTVLRSPSPLANLFTNNSSNTATFASNFYFNSGTGNPRTVTFDGTGNWQVNSAMRFSNNSAMFIVKSGSGTLTLAGSINSGQVGVTSGSTTYVINAGTLKVAGTGLLSGGTLPGTIVNNGAFSYESSASQTVSGIISGAGTFGQTAGNLTLSAVNTYSSATNITGGTLTVSGTGSIESSSGITVNGPTANYRHTSTTASTRNITLTQGTVSGTGTVGAVTVANGTGTIANGNSNSAALTIGSLAFNGAGAINVTDDGDTSTSGIVVSGALSTTPANGTITVNTSNSFWNSGVTYNLMSAGSFSGSVSDFTLGTVNGLTGRQFATLVLNGTTLGLQIGGDNPKWSGLDNSNWVVGSTGVNGNWKMIAGGTKTDYIQGDVVLFEDSATNTTVTIPANVSPAVTNFDNSAKNYTINGAFGIAAGIVNKNGTGTVTISSPNTYSGGTTISAGTIALSGAGTLGATNGTLTIVNGTLSLDGTSQTVGALAITGAAHIQSGTLTASGLTATNSSVTAEISSSLNLGSGTLSKSGDGILSLSGSTSYTGATTISGGTLALSGSATLGSSSGVTLNGGGLDLGGTTQSTNAITISAPNASGDTLSNGTISPTSFSATSTSGTATVSANITGSTGITRSGGGTLSLYGENTFTGPLNFAGNGTVIIESGSNTGGGAITYNSFGSTVTMNSGSYITSGITSSGESLFRFLNLNGGTMVSSGNIFADTRAISIVFNGGTLKCGNPAGITVFEGDNWITVNGGGATIDTTVGNVTVGNNTDPLATHLPKFYGSATGAITLVGGKTLSSGITNNSYIDIQDHSTWNLNGITSSVNGISGNGTITNSTAAGVLYLDVSSGPFDYSGAITGGAYLSLVKLGLGTQTLSGNNTYQGDTAVLGGVLDVTGNGIPDASKLVIDGGVVNVTGTEVVRALYFGTTVQAVGTWGATGSGADNIDDTRFTGSGKIQVVPAGFGPWSTTNAAGQSASEDFDLDGVSNGVEYFMGQTGSTFTASPGVVGGSVTWPKDPGYIGAYKVQTSSNLTTWTDATGAVTDNGSSITYILPTSQSKLFVRLLVTPN